MNDMGLVIVGAAGRMGQTLIRAVHSMEGARVAGAVERAGSPFLGRDAGEVAGVGTLGVPITDDPLPAFARADGVLDFSAPAASVEFAGYAAQARIVHVIGTTGCNTEDDAKIAAAARHATIVKSGNMSLGVNLLAVLVRQAAAALGADDFDIEILEMHHRNKVDAPSGFARSAWCEPCSTTRPSSRTTILSASTTVESRCAMTIVVRPFMTVASACWTRSSDSLSRADVASSRTRMGALRTMARAMETRWRCPPESVTPFSPTSVS